MDQPDLALLPVNGAREPRDVAKQVELALTGNPDLARVMPHHHRTEPQPGQTTISEPAFDQVYRFRT